MDQNARALAQMWAALFGDDEGVPFSQPLPPGQILVPLNVYETRDHVVVELSLAGYSRGDVRVESENQHVRVSASPAPCEMFEESKVHQHQFGHETAERTLELPEYLDGGQVDVAMENGLLRLVIGRRERTVKNLPIAEGLDQHKRDDDGA